MRWSSCSCDYFGKIQYYAYVYSVLPGSAPMRSDLHYSALYTCNNNEKKSKIRTPTFEISAWHLFFYTLRRDDVWNPAVMSLPPHHKWTASEWEERSRRPHLVSDSAEDASKPHKLLLNVCQWYRIGYCWIFNSLTVVWRHCLSAPVCLLLLF